MSKVYREGDLVSPPARSLQTTLVPAGFCRMLFLFCFISSEIVLGGAVVIDTECAVNNKNYYF